LVSKTNQRFLTSRATTPSYNVSENCYVLFALERSYRIIKQIVILSGNKCKRYSDTAAKLQNQYDSFSDSITVDRDLVVKDLEALRERSKIEYWQNQLLERLKVNNVCLDKQGYDHNEFYIRTQRQSKDKDCFFIETFNNGQWGQEDNKTTILSFKNYLLELVDCFEPNSEYRIIGVNRRSETLKSVRYEFSTLSLIEVITTQGLQGARNKFTEEKQLGIQLNENGWQRKLNRNELEEQEKEKTALLNRINFYTDNQKLSEYVFEKVEPKQRQLFKIIKSLRKLNIKPSSYFPNSMTFVQNPHYQGIHNGYKILREVTNLADDNLLISLEEIDSIGLVNMPLLYERWCLLQIVKVLKESFRFIPQSSWKYQLINAVKTNEIDIEVSLSNADAKRFITLTYEKTLDNGKRPDFVIDLEWYAESGTQNTKPHKKRFVLDAKFYNKATFEKFGGLMGVADQLYNQKNYKESTYDNPVFIIHPCKTALPERVTSQEWGKYSFLGELPIGGSELVDHQYGGVFLSPIDRQLYADELQRLLGLFLQYKLENSCTKGNEGSDDRT
ncbi:MAG: nuclease domain-containing protein, partial [Methylococcales bacterium]